MDVLVRVQSGAQKRLKTILRSLQDLVAKMRTDR